MLWSSLYNAISRQPLSFTRHHHVKAIINGKVLYLGIKYDAKGRPYLIKMPDKPHTEKS